MQTLNTMKDKGQESLHHLVELGKQQPEQVRTWGLTAAAAVAGSLALAATAQGILAVLTTLAAPPVALTIGAIGGGFAGWTYLQSKKAAETPAEPIVPTTVTEVHETIIA